MGTLAPTTAQAGSIGIITGGWYTSNLKNALIGAGETVTEISTPYSAASLGAYSAVIVYGNMFSLDQTALDGYVTNGGRLIETPWFWSNYSPTGTEDIFSHGGNAQFATVFPGVTVLAPGDALLTGVSFPGAGGFSIGRTQGNTFNAGVTQVANWADGTAMIGYKSVGAGSVVGIDMHVITSDSSPGVIDQAWATQLFVNAANAGAAATPEPASVVFAGAGLLGLIAARRRTRTR